jgi:arylsulfatase A-like enzyme
MDRRKFLRSFGCFAASAALAPTAVEAGVKLANQTLNVRMGRKRPNIIYIMADDLGYGDVGCFGQTMIQTPSIDKMAAEGMKFTDHYSGSTVCAPTRCVLLTGKHTGHSFIRGNWETGGYQLAIPDGEFTVGEMLKQAGYTTACIGKWGLGGPGTSGEPNDQGFDLFYGYLGQVQAHDYYPTYLWRNKTQVPTNGQYSHDLMAEESLDFVRDNKDKPFFLYLAYTIPHSEIECPTLEPYTNKPWSTTEKTFAAMVTRMDSDIGRLIDLLKELKIDDNTLVVFVSDNGPHNEGGHSSNYFDSNGPLRGIKRDLYEGGIRVPMVARWPGKVKPGATSDHISAHWDLFPTCCDLAGIETPSGLDGISFLPTLLGKTQLQHEYLYWEFNATQNGQQAVRMGKWKGFRKDVRTTSNPTLELYDLDNDIGEASNVAGSNPSVVAQIEQIMTEAHTYSSYFKLLYGE